MSACGANGAWQARTALLVVALALTAGCEERPAPAPPPVAPDSQAAAHYVVARFADLPGWDDDDHAKALPALRRSCARMARQPADRPLGAAAVAGRAGDWKAVCAEAATVAPRQSRRWLETALVPVAVIAKGAAGDPALGLFTGYFEPDVRGSRVPGGPYRYPLYAKPDDLVAGDGQGGVGRRQGGRLVPYYSRAEIDAGALDGRGLELLWLDDPVERFFLHIQGSGRVVLPDGNVQRVGFAAKNGRPFTAIGKVLRERGALAPGQATMQGIKAWLAANPAERDALLHLNESYVFFRLIDGDGPLGAEGVPLTAGRSLAVDRRAVPLGVPVWLATSHPLRPREPFERLMVAQDTGSAITGVVRGDVFWGAGDEAARAAGAMSERGRYWILVPKALAPKAGS